jgi:copper oxidase (laccase) domain-containing protein
MTNTLTTTTIEEKEIKGIFFGKTGGVSEEAKYGGSNGLNASRSSGDNSENIKNNEEIIKNQFSNSQDITLCPVRSGYSDKISVITKIENDKIHISSRETDENKKIMETTEEISINDSDVINADAVITSMPNALITIQTADAIPVLLYDSKKNVIAAASCPYYSLKKDILKKIIGVMIELGCQLENIKANIGPGRRKESYEVNATFKENWLEIHPDHEECFGEEYKDPVVGIPRYKFDMASVEKKQLLEAGIREDNINDCKIDVGSKENFEYYHTYRRMLENGTIKTGEKFGLNTSAIMIYEKSNSLDYVKSV